MTVTAKPRQAFQFQREHKMKSARKVTLVLTIIFGLQLFASNPARARTWFVERDGTGDFIVIQDAVDAAASGDTIKIGSGRFDEKHLVTTPGWSEYVRVQVTQNELTIIGSGSGTIIGQVDSWESDQGLHKGIVAAGLWGNQILRVENLHLENMGDGIYTGHESKVWSLLEVQDCSFNGSNSDITSIGGGGILRVNNCDFQNTTTEGVFCIVWNQSEVEIKECTFTRFSLFYSTEAIGLDGIQNVNIENCNFFGGSSGVSIGNCGPTVIIGCLFDNQKIIALHSSRNSIISIQNCTFKNQAVAFSSYTSDVQVEMVDSIIESVEDCSFSIYTIASLSVHNCDLAKGTRGVVYVNDNSNCPNNVHLDMANNYWGTAEADSINAWIHDRNDTEDVCYWVDFEPFLSGSTPSETPSLGGLKAMFR